MYELFTPRQKSRSHVSTITNHFQRHARSVTSHKVMTLATVSMPLQKCTIDQDHMVYITSQLVSIQSFLSSMPKAPQPIFDHQSQVRNKAKQIFYYICVGGCATIAARLKPRTKTHQCQRKPIKLLPENIEQNLDTENRVWAASSLLPFIDITSQFDQNKGFLPALNSVYA